MCVCVFLSLKKKIQKLFELRKKLKYISTFFNKLKSKYIKIYIYIYIYMVNVHLDQTLVYRTQRNELFSLF